MGPEFYQTIMGRQFFEVTAPSIAKSLEEIAKNLNKQDEPVPESKKVGGLDPEKIEELKDCVNERHDKLYFINERRDQGHFLKADDEVDFMTEGFLDGVTAVIEILGLDIDLESLKLKPGRWRE